MFLVPINYLTVFLCAIAAMAIGYVWHGPLFGKKMAMAKKVMSSTYGLMFISNLVMAYVLDHFIWYAAPESITLVIGVKTAVWSWLGMVATVSLTQWLYSPDKKPISLLAIQSGYYLVTLVTMGAILAILR